MANIFGIQDLVDGDRHLVVKVDIEGDGSGDETVPVAEVALKGCREFSLAAINGRLEGFTAHLEWDGPTKVPFWQIPDDDDFCHDWSKTQPLSNPKVANYTGNVNLVTSGLGAGEVGTLVMHFLKRDIP